MRWCQNGNFFCPVFAASHVKHISDLHSKFALGPHHVKSKIKIQGQGLHLQGQNKDLCGKATILELGAYAFHIGLFQYCELFVVRRLIKCFFLLKFLFSITVLATV